MPNRHGSTWRSGGRAPIRRSRASGPAATQVISHLTRDADRHRGARWSCPAHRGRADAPLPGPYCLIVPESGAAGREERAGLSRMGNGWARQIVDGDEIDSPASRTRSRTGAAAHAHRPGDDPGGRRRNWRRRCANRALMLSKARKHQANIIPAMREPEAAIMSGRSHHDGNPGCRGWRRT